MADQSPTPGTLKIFLGMCPGVGKTYAMLQAARELLQQGTDVVVGVVETHGRKDTASLLEGLEILPQAERKHRDAIVTEFDLDAMIQRKPEVALIDELAHTNAPGSRHPKRWQDVVELLESGINVLTTINIQHLESRADVVTAITKAPVRETVPDSFLDRAEAVELIDLTPGDLRKRLEQGKVYQEERSITAANNFFKESNLTALRQLALRYTAERVGVDLREFQAQRRDRSAWRTAEKLMVAVGPSPYSPALIRRTRAMAGALDAPWSAIVITTDEPLSKHEEEAVALHLSLARQLGAEVATISAPSLIEGLLRAARERNVTQVIIGKSARHHWRDRFFHPPALRLLQQSGDIDVVAIEPGIPAEGIQQIEDDNGTRRKWAQHWSQEIIGAFRNTAILGVIALIASEVLDSNNLALLMLCGVIVGSLSLRTLGTFVSAVLTGMTWNYFFAEPRYTLCIATTADVTMFSALTIAAMSMGYLSNRIHRRERSLSKQQLYYSRLLEINSILTQSHDTDETVRKCLAAISSQFRYSCNILLRSDHDHQLQKPFPDGSLTMSEKEQSVAQWAYEKSQMAGRGTSTLPQAKALHLPMQGRSFVMGILAIGIPDKSLPPQEMDQLCAIAAQLGLALERNHLLRAIHHAEFLERSDQLRRTLLDHVSHELRTPVAVLSSSIDALAHGSSADQLLPEMRTAQKRLRRVVDQLVESARVESGAVQARPEWNDLLDLLETAQSHCSDQLTEHPLEITIAENTPPLVQIDGELVLAILENLLINSAHHTPAGTRIFLHASLTDAQELQLSLRDQGPGLENPELIFNRFVRGKNSRPGGLGLGLSIVRGLTRGMGGTIQARNHPEGGAEFLIRLPAKTALEIPEHSA
jgi:two-component system, OmpR family, sensor histidine kinase KdpD